MMYIDTGSKPKNKLNMDRYESQIDYDRLGELVDKLPWIDVEETLYLVLDDELDIYKDKSPVFMYHLIKQMIPYPSHLK